MGNLTPNSAHGWAVMRKEGREVAENLGFRNEAEGILWKLLDDGSDYVEAVDMIEQELFKGSKMPRLSKNFRAALDNVIEQDWTLASFRSQKRLVQILEQGEDKDALNAAKTILDRGGWQPSQEREVGRNNAKTLEEIQRRQEEIRKLLEGGETIEGKAE